MLAPKLVAALVFFLIGSAFANDFFFHTALNCGGAMQGCHNARAGQCCTASRPFTRSLRARTARRNDVYGFDSRRCGGRAALVRRCDSGNCCYRMPGTANVAAQWFRGGGAAADQADQAEQAEQAEVIQSRDDDKDNNNTEQEECIEPDYFMFFDSEGNQHEIRIPEGKYQEATEHYVKGEWENLTAYPAWSE